MDATRISTLPLYRESNFRTPRGAERLIELWVDRIGRGPGGQEPERLRILGQYAAVAILSGTGWLLTADAGNVPLQSGDVIILTPQLAAAYFSNPPGWQTCWVVWNGPAARHLERLNYIASDQAVIHHAATIVERSHRALATNIRQADLGAVLERKVMVMEMILELYRIREAGRRKHSATGVGEAAVRYFNHNYRQDPGIAALAADFALSPSQFRRLFKAYCGLSPLEYLLTVRISRAKELLAGGMTIAEVAERVGYHDQFYFMRVFKKIAGVTPGEFANSSKLLA